MYQDNAADAYGECYGEEPLVLKPGVDTTLTFTITNDGTQDNTYSTVIIFNEIPGWITVTPPAGVIPYGLDNTREISLQIEALDGLPDPAILTAEVIVNHDAVANSPLPK